MNLPEKIEYRPVSALLPYARNSRTHSDAQVAEVAASIREFGWTNPILVDAEGVVIAGHARLLAARKLGMDRVPVIVLSHLSPAQQRALVIADNKLALNAGWDEEMLRGELQGLEQHGFNLELIGFTDEELEGLLANPEETVEGESEEDAVPEAQKRVVTAPGDVWILGDHRLICGSATEMAAVEKVLAGGLADMVFTDPPYNVAYEGKTSKKLKIDNDALGGKFYEFLRDACANMLAVTNGAIYICMSSSECRSDYQRQYEPILYGWRQGSDHFWCGDRNQGDVWAIKRPMANLEHPTMKPVELVERAIRNSSKSRDTILDCFGGSGTTLIACHKTGRQARLIELDPKYCDVIVRRWQEFAGAQAYNEDGVAFNVLAERMEAGA
jgi:DNA modification methylase